MNTRSLLNASSAARASQLLCRRYATGANSTPPMLLKIRKDMKTAMQNKDTTRLAVLRSLLSSTLNASKTANPIHTDMQMLALLRKGVKERQAAAEEFKGAGRQDLVDKEMSQVTILEEYAGGVEVMGLEEVRKVVGDLIESMESEGVRLTLGDVLKKVFAPEALGEKPVDKAAVSKIVKELLA